ncbi:MAG TPA: alkaline phosphatase PhoX, partial [Methylomirabilota bacterium]|nr:alkaline phosphatase PhoX [Methylomirabilota bacterium]
MSFQNEISEQAMRGVNDAPNDTLQDVLRRQYSRRQLLKNAALAAPGVILSGRLLAASDAYAAQQAKAASGHPADLGFEPISLTKVDDVIVPEGYGYQVVLRWGDPLLPGAPEFDAHQQS